MTRSRRVVYECVIFLGLFIGFVAFLWLWFHTQPAPPADFPR